MATTTVAPLIELLPKRLREANPGLATRLRQSPLYVAYWPDTDLAYFRLDPTGSDRTEASVTTALRPPALYVTYDRRSLEILGFDVFGLLHLLDAVHPDLVRLFRQGWRGRVELITAALLLHDAIPALAHAPQRPAAAPEEQLATAAAALWDRLLRCE